MTRRRLITLTLTFVVAIGAGVRAQGPTKESIDGIRNFTNVGPTIACAGATEARAMSEIARRGYRAVINLRLPGEEGASIDEARAAAEAAGIRFIHLPFDSRNPDPAAVDRFLEAAVDPANQPTFIHCGSASRVAAMMIARRMLVDGWDEARALEEASVIGPPSPQLQKFALDYVASKRTQ